MILIITDVLRSNCMRYVDKAGCSKTLTAWTFTGAGVLAGNVCGLQTLVKNKYPSATFAHCYNHSRM